MLDLGTASKSSGCHNKNHQVAPKTSICHFGGSAFFLAHETLKNAETLSGLDLRFVYVFHCFVFSYFRCTLVTKQMISCFCDCAESIKKHQADWPVEIQGAPKWDPNIDHMAQEWHPFLKDAPPKTCS